jgi:hypothetical protein
MAFGASFVSSRAKKFADHQMFNRPNLQFRETSFPKLSDFFRSTFDRFGAPRVAQPGSASLRLG